MNQRVVMKFFCISFVYLYSFSAQSAVVAFDGMVGLGSTPSAEEASRSTQTEADQRFEQNLQLVTRFEASRAHYLEIYLEHFAHKEVMDFVRGTEGVLGEELPTDLRIELFNMFVDALRTFNMNSDLNPMKYALRNFLSIPDQRNVHIIREVSDAANIYIDKTQEADFLKLFENFIRRNKGKSFSFVLEQRMPLRRIDYSSRDRNSAEIIRIMTQVDKWRVDNGVFTTILSCKSIL